MENYIGYFLLTIAIELPVIWLFFRRKKIVLFALLVNCILHPVTWIFFYSYLAYVPSHFAALIWLEIAIALIEGILLAWYSKQIGRGLAAGVVANYSSFILGNIIITYI